MRTIQDKVLANLEGRILLLESELNLEVVQQADWSNQGRLIVQPEDSPETVCTILYGFQSGYATFTFQRNDEERPEQRKDNHAYMVFAHQHSVEEGVHKMLELVQQAIMRWETEQ